MKKRYGLSSIFVFILLVSLEGCYSRENTPLASPSVSITRELTPIPPISTLTPTLQVSALTSTVPEPILLPVETLSPREAETRLLDLLKTNGNCTRKCIAGIRPDDMTTQQAVDTMAQWGMISPYKMPKGGFNYSRTQEPLDAQVRVKLGMSTQPDNLESIHSIGFSITNAAANDFVGKDLWLANFERWQAFRFDHVIKAYGVPSYVGYFFESIGGENNTPLVKDALNYHMLIFFEKINITVTVPGRGNHSEKGLAICPSTDAHNMAVEINSGVPLEKLEEVYPVTWQAATDTDLEAFFQHFTQKSDACTTITMEQIQALQPWFH